jgi:flavin reductase (DIM6/NTAB) family NADH-FMN oxidoreductase RutF
MLRAERTYTEILDTRELRRVLGSFATGVTVVTALDEDGRPRGMTANSFTSVSLRPPLVLVCVASASSMWRIFAKASHFAVNVLGGHQRELSARFAGPAPDRFAGVSWSPGSTGAPLLDGVLAYLECRRYRDVEAGDHMILLGEVVSIDRNSHPPLVFHQGDYAIACPLSQTGDSHA